MKKHSNPQTTLGRLKGASQLASGAVIGVTDIAENLHREIKTTSMLGRVVPSAGAGGLSGFVYRRVRGVTIVIRASIDLAIDSLAKLLPSEPENAGASKRYDAAAAALNGVVGDYLDSSNNALAITMTFRQDGVAFDATRATVNNKLVVFVHGLCMNDLQWSSDTTRVDQSFGAQLSKQLGYSVVYLYYNTGRHIAVNGEEFAAQLEELVANWPCDLKELAIIGHSMGGLVTRRACAVAQARSMRWLKQLKTIIFLGTPHHGAPLEKAGAWVDSLLGMNAYTRPFTKLSLLRSAGIQDLRHGRLQNSSDKQVVQLPEGVRCYAVAATLSEAGSIKNLAGDGLVSVNSALGKHKDPAMRLNFQRINTRIFYGINHFGLINDPRVLADIKHWLAP